MMTNSTKSLATDTEPNRRDMSWNAVEQKIRERARAAIDEMTNEEARRLYQLALRASRHSGESPGKLLERAETVLR